MDLHINGIVYKLQPVAPCSTCFAIDPGRMFSPDHTLFLPPQPRELPLVSPDSDATMRRLVDAASRDMQFRGDRAKFRDALANAALLRAVHCASTRIICFEDVVPASSTSLRKFVPPPFLLHLVSLDDYDGGAECDNKSTSVYFHALPMRKLLEEMALSSIDLDEVLTGWSRQQLALRRVEQRRAEDRKRELLREQARREADEALALLHKQQQQEQQQGGGGGKKKKPQKKVAAVALSKKRRQRQEEDDDEDDDDDDAKACRREKERREEELKFDGMHDMPQLLRFITIRRVWRDDMAGFTVDVSSQLPVVREAVDSSATHDTTPASAWRQEGNLLLLNKRNIDAFIVASKYRSSSRSGTAAKS